ncbi:hypothetical protein CJEDD_10685 [Corynebacterium jeddahense]|uniref:Transposase n=1 Tax=Corynebacterium jeddahense TaxID=1414719 RepID=A0ABY7UM73_9CORY|nr:hypothetical protein CJEDD_10685 [Corynebacterium jeddahense]
MTPTTFSNSSRPGKYNRAKDSIRVPKLELSLLFKRLTSMTQTLFKRVQD